MRREPVAAVALLLVLAAVACGGGGASAADARTEATTSTGATSTAPPEDGRREAIAGALGAFVAADPGPSCLLATDGAGVLVEHDADTPLTPASGMKLVTAAAVLAVLGPDAVLRNAGGDAGAGALVERMLRDSDNDASRALLEAVRATGVDVVTALERQGLPVAGTVVADGSGLDRGNRTTCRLLHAVVDRADADGPIIEGLPVAGRTGTLRDRYGDGPLAGRLRAKTGSIRSVATLAGLVAGTDGAHGDRLVFAYISNGVATTDAGVARQDALARALATGAGP